MHWAAGAGCADLRAPFPAALQWRCRCCCCCLFCLLPPAALTRWCTQLRKLRSCSPPPSCPQPCLPGLPPDLAPPARSALSPLPPPCPCAFRLLLLQHRPGGGEQLLERREPAAGDVPEVRAARAARAAALALKRPSELETCEDVLSCCSFLPPHLCPLPPTPDPPPARAPYSTRSRKSFAFNSDRPGAGGEANRDAFVASMKTVEVTFQNLDSSEISLTGGRGGRLVGS